MATKNRGAKGTRTQVVEVTAKRYKGPNINVEDAESRLSPHDFQTKYHMKGAKSAASFSNPPSEYPGVD